LRENPKNGLYDKWRTTESSPLQLAFSWLGFDESRPSEPRFDRMRLDIVTLPDTTVAITLTRSGVQTPVTLTKEQATLAARLLQTAASADKFRFSMDLPEPAMATAVARHG
jgi:hypothetical protein